MIEQVKDLVSIPLSIFESIFATKICNFQNERDTIAYFNEFDKSILTLLEDELKEQYEKEQVHDFLAQNPLLLSQNYVFISDKIKNDFIDEFYNKHQDLKYIGSLKIKSCLAKYVNEINLLLDKILSVEGKVILQKVDTTEKSIINELQNAKQEIVSEFKTSLSQINKEQTGESNPIFYNIGRKNKLFYGRNQKIKEILLKLSEDKLVFLTGASGMGKSQIAQEIVCRLQDRYNLIMWFPANTEIELFSEFNTAAITYNLINEKKEDFKYLTSIMSTFIGKFSRSLIIYDGADDIPVEFLTEKCIFPHSDTIVTTQNSNVDSDEFSVIPIDTFTPEEAESFLMTYSNNRKQTEQDIKIVATLCDLLENYPLALEYARAYVNKTQNSFLEYMKIYKEHKHDILSKPLTKYEKTAYTAWKLSYDKIVRQSKAAKDILNILSFLDTHDIPLRDIFVLSQQYSLDKLNSILLIIKNYSLLTIQDNFANIHEITQEFIRLQMQKDQEYQTYYEKTLHIFSELMPDRITNAAEKDLVNRITKHAIQLISYNCNINDKNTLNFAANIASKLYILGYYTQTISFIQEQILLYDSSTQNFNLFQMITFISQAYHYIGEDSNALRILKNYCLIVSSSEKLTNSEKWQLLSRFKNVEGIIQKEQGEFSQCLESFFESLEFLNKLSMDSDNEIKSNILNNIGIVYKHLGQYNNALEYYNQALSCSANDKHLLLRIYGNIATVFKSLNQFKSAFKYFEICLNYSIELGDKRNECICLGNLADCYIDLNQYDNATLNLNKSLQIANELNYIIGIINAYYNLGRIAFLQQNYIKAKEYWELSLNKSYAIDYKSGIDFSYNALNQLPK